MKRNYCYILLLILLLCACSSRRDKPALYEEMVMTLEEQEKARPLHFLSADGKWWENLLGLYVIEATIKNTAVKASYHDVVMEFRFYSKTGTLLGTRQKTFYEYFPPQQQRTFKVKYEGYRDTHSIGWEVIQASAD